MNNYNERVNNEADEHAQMMQDQRKQFKFKTCERESFMLKCGAPALTNEEMAEIDSAIASMSAERDLRAFNHAFMRYATVAALSIIAYLLVQHFFLSCGGI